ncbi:uncharacterized protein LOC141855288 [Brevipalpus obovatus]|uniref:uncharacterized protein LOC141855288 n=1 Tax=Brevipalpus obovatus TaxID=246614 RepID=UPI003D9DDDE8
MFNLQKKSVLFGFCSSNFFLQSIIFYGLIFTTIVYSIAGDEVNFSNDNQQFSATKRVINVPFNGHQSTEDPIYQIFPQNNLFLKNYTRECEEGALYWELSMENDQYTNEGISFRIDSSSGNVFMSINPEYENQRSTPSFGATIKGISVDPQYVCFLDRVQFVLESMVEDSPNTLHKRTKRQAVPITKSRAQFSIKNIDGDPERCKPGDTLHYAVDIRLKGTEPTNFYVEIFTSDPKNSEFTPLLSIYNISLNYDRSAMSISDSYKSPTMQLSKVSKNIYDRAILDLEGVKASSADSDSLLTLTFSLAMSRSEDAQVTKDKHHVTVGIEYQNAKFVWIGQDSIKYGKTRSDATVSASVTGPDTISLGYSAVYKIASKIAMRSENVRVDVSIQNFDYENENLVTLGMIAVEEMGQSFSINPINPTHYPTQRTATKSGMIYTRSRLNMGYLISLAAHRKSLSSADHKDHTMNFQLAVHAMNITENVDKIANISVKIYTGNKDRFSETLRVKLSNKTVQYGISNLISLEGNMMAPNISTGDAVTVNLNASMGKTNTFSVLEVRLAQPESFGGEYPITSCAARFVPAQNLFNLAFYNSSWIKPSIDNETNNLIFTLEPINLVNIFASTSNNILIEMILIASGKPRNNIPVEIIAQIHGTSGSGRTFSGSLNITQAEADLSPEESVKGTAEPLVGWKDLYGQGGLAIQNSITLSPSTNFSDLKLGLNFKPKDVKESTWTSVKVCRYEIVSIGDALPCTLARTGDLKSQAISSFGKNIDDVELLFGDVCALNTSQKQANTRTLTTSVTVAAAGNNTENVEGELMFTLESGGKNIWNQNLPTGIVIETPSKAHSKQVKISAFKTIPDPVGVGRSTTGSILIILSEGSLAELSVEIVMAEASRNYGSICGLTIKSVGYNMPCFEQKNKTVFESQGRGQNIGAILNLGTVGNFGPSKVILPTLEAEEANKIRLTALVNVGEDASTDLRFDVKVRNGKSEESSAFIVPVNKFPSQLKGIPRKLIVNTTDQPVPIGGPAIVKLLLLLRPQTMVQPIIRLPKSTKYEVYDATVSGIGESFPCYSPKSVKKDMKNGVIDMGVITNARGEDLNTVDQDADNPEDLIEISVAIKISDSLVANESIEFQAILTNSLKEAEIKSTGNLTTSVDIEENEPSEIQIKANDNETFLERRETRWIPVNLTISPFTRARLIVRVEGEVIDNRPLVSIRGIEVAGRGNNLPVPGPRTNLVNLHERENKLEITYDYLANFGFSHLFNSSAADGDDDLILKVLVQMMDHPLMSEERRSSIRLSVSHGNRTLAETERHLRLASSSVLKNRIDLKATCLSESFKRSEMVEVQLELKHAIESNLEPVDSKIRFFMPPYMSFLNLTYSSVDNVTIEPYENITSFDIKIPTILFWETQTIRITLMTDPKNTVGYGRGHIATSIPIAIFLDRMIISPFRQIKFDYFSEECYENLALDNCQITASSAINQAHEPSRSKLDADRFWSPSMASSFEHDYLEYDFLHPTRVTAVRFQVSENHRKVTAFHIEVSSDRENWIKMTNTAVISSSIDLESDSVRLGADIETRFMRLVIEASDPAKNENDILFVKVGLLGCPLHPRDQPTDLETVPCDSPPKTWFDDDRKEMAKQFINDHANRVTYACDFIDDPSHRSCIRSHDDGDSWLPVPTIVYTLIGFDRRHNRTLARDKMGKNILASSDGERWSPIKNDEEFNRTLTDSKNFIEPSLIGSSINRWKINGLHISKSNHVKILWKQSCR